MSKRQENEDLSVFQQVQSQPKIVDEVKEATADKDEAERLARLQKRYLQRFGWVRIL